MPKKKFEKPGNPISIAEGRNLSGKRYQAMYNKQEKEKKKGMKGALKSLKYKPQTKKGQYKEVTKKLQGKTDAKSKGAASVFSMMRQERAQSARGGGGTASAVANPRTKRKVYNAGDRMVSNVTFKSAGKDGIKQGRKSALKAMQYKPVAAKPGKGKGLKKLDRVLRTQKAGAEKVGNVRASRRAEGALRAVSLMRQENAQARRGRNPRKRKGSGKSSAK